MKKLSPEYIRIIGGLVVVALMFVGWYIFTYQDKSYAPVYPLGVEVSTSPEISASELRAFLKTWHKYLEDGMDKVGYSQLSLSSKHSAAEITPKVARWLKRKGWNPDRFFYVEQRLRAIITTIKRDERIVKTNMMIKKRLKNEDNGNLATALSRLSENESKKLNVEQITEAERRLVAPELEEVIILLKGSGN